MPTKNALHKTKEKNKMNTHGIIGPAYFSTENNNWLPGKPEFICFVSLDVLCELIQKNSYIWTQAEIKGSLLSNRDAIKKALLGGIIYEAIFMWLPQII